ncbi:putative in Between Ring fingers [Lyophyllum shimeji]|uniref:RBR-type E3 ubiquitin transferase n=1 Tax=Lyophyllum shimeji TaxID=47721 RepID=A0A9P3PXV6_LYOSH|nr:putative in Between Ring fingers [Lyophyllum shimeji]
MSSDYEISDDDENYYDYDEDMIDGTQDEEEEDGDMYMDTYGDDFKVAPKNKRKPYEIEYESLSQAAVEKLMQEDVEHICGIFGVDGSTAALLLRHMSWNKERLIEKYMDNPSKVLVDAGVTVKEPSSPSAPVRSHSSSNSNSNANNGRRPTRSTSKLIGLASGSKSPKIPTVSPPALRPSKPTRPTPFVCPICFDDSPDLKPLSLDCEHSFCSGCWTAYVSSKINDEAEHCIRCMAEGCALVTPDPFIRALLLVEPTEPVGEPSLQKENVATWARFQELLVRHFVASNPNLKYCPYPSCTNTVSCPGAASKASLATVVPIVSCGRRGFGITEEMSQSQPVGMGLAAKEHKFCFGCPIESDHRPVVCNVAKMWLKKCRDDSETANWIKSNTKECPQCQSTIEKNGGCNHMTCKKCKHDFCWVCMGPWAEHGTAWYSCNRFDEKGSVEARDAQSRSRASLERYLHYYNRWANHEQSAKLSVELYTKTEKKMEDMQITSALTWIEVQFMKKAVEEVEKCRTTLKWTYAMAYYLARGNEKELFEDNQRDLEKAVEDLSELLEQPIEAENIPTLRQKVTDKTVYVQKRNDIVLEDTAMGFLEGRWKWNVAVEGFDEPEKVEF